MRIPPSGEQHEISLGDQRAVVVEVGASVREYEVGGRPVLEPFPVEAMCDGAHGAPLIPWPNRLAGGTYRFDGEELRVALTEPEKGNAIHGLLRWRPWRARSHEGSRVVMGCRLYPMAGYPFCLDVEVAHSLGDDGLKVSTTATNLGESACPYGAGHHPYLSAGGGRIDDCVLRLEASTRILTDEVRQLPIGAEAVEGTPFDFRGEGRRLGDQQVDFPFRDLARDADGRAWARLTGPDGRTAELWVDETYPVIEIYTGDTLAPHRRRLGLGAEPMTCPPNAFQSGEGVVRLEPGASITTTWGVRLA